MTKDDRPPGFFLYVDDFACDGKVEAMTTEEVGAYILLLCKAWREEPPGSLPSDDYVLARWARLTSDRWAEGKARVLAAFSLGTDSRWHQKRMRKEYLKMRSSKEKRLEAAYLGSEAKWGKRNTELHRKSRSERLAVARQKGKHTDEEWLNLKERCDNHCVRCGAGDVELVRDHITPIYQGGSDGIDNIQPLCRKCNASKGPESKDFRPEMPAKRLPNACEDACQTPGDDCLSSSTSISTSSKDPPNPPGGIGLFDEFWEFYPRRVKKPQAKKAFLRLKPDQQLLDSMRMAIDQSKASEQWQRDGGKFIPHPATWLNNRQWEDEIPEVASRGDTVGISHKPHDESESALMRLRHYSNPHINREECKCYNKHQALQDIALLERTKRDKWTEDDRKLFEEYKKRLVEKQRDNNEPAA